MLPYEILLGLRSSMCNCSRGVFNGKQKYLVAVNYDVQSHYNYSTQFKKIEKNSFFYTENKNLNFTRKFHKSFEINCQVTPKEADSNVTVNDEIPQVATDDFVNKIIQTPLNNENLNNFGTFKNKSSDPKLPFIPQSIKNWLDTTTDKLPSKEIEKQFSEPKLNLHNYFNIISVELKIDKPLIMSSKHVNLKKNTGWSITYQILWPEKKSFTTIASSKATASKSAAQKCLYWLNYMGKMSKNKMPFIYEKSEALNLLQNSQELKIESEILNKIESFLDTNEEKILDLSNKNMEEETNDPLQIPKKSPPISYMSVDAEARNRTLLHRLINRVDNKPDLPIFNYKEQILKELDENQALVIKGDTGCGKTTQVPQFILDYFTQKEAASNCNMIVTQPRRISTISLAERIAFERQERVGDVVGYQVRLQQVLPKQPGAILFCTTGILLKKMQGNPTLEGCTHVIIDEAHERNVDTDMLLVLLRRAMLKNPKLKVVIMSATINAELFQNYLGCKGINVPGRLYPVETHFLEDIEQLGIPRYKKDFEDETGPVIDCDQISDLINHLDNTKPPGAILCFLPGWNDIQRVQMTLEQQVNKDKQLIIPIHSKIPYMSQSKIFQPPPGGIRKIILSTDIAETGITIPDVVYVVDSAARKEVRWHENRGVSSIDTFWVSKANINQRKGRAGRVQKGESYHFIYQKDYEKLPVYPIPEVLRVSLEKVVLDGKIYSNESAEDFLGSMPQPPRITSVQKAVSDLQTLGALDLDENLTDLGKRIALFAIHPKLSKAMVYSTIFQCLNPVTTISSMLSLDNTIFFGSLTNKSRIRQTKTRFQPSSDHLAVAWLYAEWNSKLLKNPAYAASYSRKNNLHVDRMVMLHRTRDLNLEHLRESGLIADIYRSSDFKAKENDYSTLDEMVRGVLLAGMDQILLHRNFEIRKGRITKSSKGSMITEDEARAQLTPDSVNYKRTNWPSPYSIYYQKTHSTDMRLSLIRESSIISPLTTLLFSQGRISGSKYESTQPGENTDNMVLLKVEGKKNIRIHCDKRTAETLLRFRDLMWTMVHYFVKNNINYTEEEIASFKDQTNMITLRKEMLDVLAKLLSHASENIDSLEPENSNYDDKYY